MSFDAQQKVFAFQFKSLFCSDRS